MTPRIALTPGEPAGIGPDLTVMLAQHSRQSEVIAIADPELLEQRAKLLDLPIRFREVRLQEPPVGDEAGTLALLPERLRTPSRAGQLNPDNAAYVLATLDTAIDGCLRNDFDAMVTAPLHKGVINDAGMPFTGHTEHLAMRCNSEVVMMLVADTLRVALVTTHLPLSQVAASLTPELVERVVKILHRDLVSHFGLDDPHILVCGLNPHAGEGGHMGREEIDVITPTLERCRAAGIRLTGPLPADTLFTPHHLVDADAVLAMYHDQGLPVLKYAGFGRGINVTLGLPIIRTSVDHGTALDKAGTGQIDSGSLNAALTLAESMAIARHPTT